jgi:hypothetical protein
MLRLFRRGSGGGSAKPSLDSVRFDTTGYTAQGEPRSGELRTWRTPEGDGVGVYYFALPPDLPANASSVDELAAFYRGRFGDSGSSCVEIGTVLAGGCPAVRILVSVPQQPSGRTYVGSLTLPFRDFSFVIKCQCEERGLTGAKEAALFDRSLAAGEPTPLPPGEITSGRLQLSGFDPDDPRHDAEFPDHPVARARRVLAHVNESLVVSAEVRARPGFALPF